MLRQVSELSGGVDEAVHLSDWAALMRLPRPCSTSNTHELFYPNAPDDVLADPSDQGHLYRRAGFLVGLEHGHYHNAARYVLDHAGEEFIDIPALLRTGRRDGKIMSEVMCHVRIWTHSQPTEVGDRENNKPQLWRDFVPALGVEFGGQAPRRSRELQRQLFSVMKGGLDQLEGSFGGNVVLVDDDTYLERFRLPIWRDILMTVRVAGVQLQGKLATLKLTDPKSALCKQEPALIGSLSRAISRLPEVTGNPTLRASGTVEELMRRIKPIVIEWAVQNCQKGLAAQATEKVPRWPLSIRKSVEEQHQALRGISANPTTDTETEEDLLVCTPPRSLLSRAVASFKPPPPRPPPPPPSRPGRIVAERRLSAEPTDGTGESREINAGESRRTDPVSSGALRRKARRARLARLAAEMSVDMGSGPLYTPPMISPVKGQLPLTPARSDPPWMGKPAARTNRG